MKAKLIFDGREIEVEIAEEFALELTKALPAEKKKTGYERVEQGESYFMVNNDGEAIEDTEEGHYYDDKYYDIANYYSDETVAENNARADSLFRQLRRFAVEHRENPVVWKEGNQKKFAIAFGYDCMDFFVRTAFSLQSFGGIYFDSEETARLAINTFRDELMWFFTAYKDSL